MAAPNTQQSTRILDDESPPQENVVTRQDDDAAISDLLDSALKNTMVTIGTVWFVATLVAIGAYAMQLQLLTIIAAFAVASMMCAWLAGLCFMVANWATRRFPVIAAWPRWRSRASTPE